MYGFFSADVEDLVSPVVALSNRIVVSWHFEGMYHLHLQGLKMEVEMEIHEESDGTSLQNVRNQ
jgi:hypothetical protein